MDYYHAVRFYKDSASLAGRVAEFILEGFDAGSPAIVVATPRHRARILITLRRRSVDIVRIQADGGLLLLDAYAVLSRFMVNGMPDVAKFHRVVTPLLEKAGADRGGTPIRVYGEIVDVLWKANQASAALRLESLWNQLAESYRFALLCGYSLNNAYDAHGRQEICACHTQVLFEPDEPRVH